MSSRLMSLYGLKHMPFRADIPVAVVPAGAAGTWNAGRKAGITSKADLSTKNLERLGFTQYKKAGGGEVPGGAEAGRADGHRFGADE